MSQTGETNGAQIAASVPNKKLKLRRKKIIQWIVIGLLFGGAIYLIYWGITRKKDPAKYPKKVRFGFCVAAPNEGGTMVMDFKQFPKGMVDHFWNWKKEATTVSVAATYNIDMNATEFLPMIWGLEKAAASQNSFKTIMLWNEPDMVGNCLKPLAAAICDNDAKPPNPATSSGYWLTEGAYGCIQTIATTCDNDNNGVFEIISANIIDVIKHTDKAVEIILPAMSQHAKGDCVAYFDNGIPVSTAYPPKCGENNDKECVCNGWLSLLKDAMLKTDNGKLAWKRARAISIHAYYPKAHYVKLKILSFLKVFEDDVRDGKVLWLTETAFVDKKGQGEEKVPYIKRAAEFARDLLHRETVDPSVTCSIFPDNSFTFTGALPGLLETKEFEFNGRNLCWRDHGLELVSWFALENFSSFGTGCNGVVIPEEIYSSPLDLGQTPNELFKGIFNQT